VVRKQIIKARVETIEESRLGKTTSGDRRNPKATSKPHYVFFLLFCTIGGVKKAEKERTRVK